MKGLPDLRRQLEAHHFCQKWIGHRCQHPSNNQIILLSVEKKIWVDLRRTVINGGRKRDGTWESSKNLDSERLSMGARIYCFHNKKLSSASFKKMRVTMWYKEAIIVLIVIEETIVVNVTNDMSCNRKRKAIKRDLKSLKEYQNMFRTQHFKKEKGRKLFLIFQIVVTLKLLL